MKNIDLIEFAKTWHSFDVITRDMIEDIVNAQPFFPSQLLARININALQDALEELRRCNVPQLVRLLDEACEEALCYRHENKI